MISDDKYRRHFRVAILNFIVDRPRRQRQLTAVAVDAMLCYAAVVIAFSLRLGVWDLVSTPILIFSAIALALWYPIAWRAGVYRSLVRYSGARTVADLVIACGLLTLPLVAILVTFRIHDVPRTLAVLHPIIFLLLLASSRIFVRFALLDLLKVVDVDARRVLVYGAGRAGQQLALSLRHEPKVHLEIGRASCRERV